VGGLFSFLCVWSDGGTFLGVEGGGWQYCFGWVEILVFVVMFRSVLHVIRLEVRASVLGVSH